MSFKQRFRSFRPPTSTTRGYRQANVLQPCYRFATNMTIAIVMRAPVGKLVPNGREGASPTPSSNHERTFTEIIASRSVNSSTRTTISTVQVPATGNSVPSAM